MRRAHEAAVVGRSLDLDDRVVHLPAGAGERLLQLGLVVDVTRARVLDALRERVHDGRLDHLEPVLEVDGRDRGLEHRGKDVAAAGDALELVARRVARELQQPLAEAELLRDCGAAQPRYDVRAHLGEPAFGCSGEAIEHCPRDGELEDAVAEELESLVRVRTILDPRRVGEHLLETLGGKLRDQPTELVRPALRRSPARSSPAQPWCAMT